MMRRENRWMGCIALFVVIIAAILAYPYYIESKAPKRIAFVSKSTHPNYIFWQTMRMGAELAAKEENITFQFVGPLEERDTEKQIRLMQSCIDGGVDVILLAACDSEALNPLVRDARAKGITIVTVDSTVEEPTSLIATDNQAAARAVTAYLIEMLGEVGKVAMVSFIQGTSTSIERENGYEEEIVLYDAIEKIPTIYTEGTTENAYEATLALLREHPDMKGIIGANQYTLEGICMAVEELGLGDAIKVVGFDSSRLIISGLEKGIIDAIVVQKPFNMGYLGVKNALALHQGKEVPDFTDTGYKLVLPSTLYETENQKLIYPIID